MQKGNFPNPFTMKTMEDSFREFSKMSYGMLGLRDSRNYFSLCVKY